MLLFQNATTKTLAHREHLEHQETLVLMGTCQSMSINFLLINIVFIVNLVTPVNQDKKVQLASFTIQGHQLLFLAEHVFQDRKDQLGHRDLLALL